MDTNDLTIFFLERAAAAHDIGDAYRYDMWRDMAARKRVSGAETELRRAKRAEFIGAAIEEKEYMAEMLEDEAKVLRQECRQMWKG